MDVLFPILFILFILLVFVTLVGHGIWIALAWFFRAISRSDKEPIVQNVLSLSPSGQAPRGCPNCKQTLTIHMKFCGVCGAHRVTMREEEELRELEITLRQIDRLRQAGEYEADFHVVKSRIEAERERILFPNGRPQKAEQPPQPKPRETVVSEPQPSPEAEKPEKSAAPFITPVVFEDIAREPAPHFEDWSKASHEAPAPPVSKPPRKPFTDVLATFMEQSNVRWGEIIGGLLIIGCSTALVISLWAQISRVPVMKFLIFTTVTAALFGIGFYTEHHWKLPTTSRGLLTIATVLVPLNFLAIAAVSTNTTPGVLVIGSEFIAPAIFLCLVYYAGRVIAAKWPHLLAAGALGSSVGQLLIRHFAVPELGTNWFVLLGAFPVICYVAACGWMLKLALADGEIDETEATEIFTTLGALTFAVVLPFGLLLYKSTSTALALIHLAPLVTLAAMPTLASGMLLWRRAAGKELAATRTAGASIAIFGMLVALASMALAWPNPASVIPAALFNFVLFSTVAIALEEPRAHVVAAGCLTFAYVIGFHVVLGHVPWQNLRVMSLLDVTNHVSTGQSLAIPFVAFVLAHEWLRSRRERDARSYLIAACAVAVASLIFFAEFAIGIPQDPFHVSAIIALYAAGTFWFAWRRKEVGFTWAGAVLLFLGVAQACHSLLILHFPWQAAGLFFALLCVAGALAVRKVAPGSTERLFVGPLQRSAAIGCIGAASLLIAELFWFGSEPAAVFAARTMVLAAVLFGLLILRRSIFTFTAFQVALALGAVLLTKTTLQQFAWYGFRPNASLHPWALEIHAVVLGLMCAAWIATRFVVRRRATAQPAVVGRNWTSIIPDLPLAFDHLLALALVIGFAALLIFGSASGISKELTSAARVPRTFDLVGFPHEAIFSGLCLLVLVVLLAVMLANLRERRREPFALGALIVVWCLCPIIAGKFEAQFGTASAGRWMLAMFLLLVSVAYAIRERIRMRGWQTEWLTNARALVLFISLAPLILLTLSPVIDDVNYVPARGPQAGIFRAMGAIVLYSGPLLIAAVALGIHAVRERSAAFTFGAGLLINFTVITVQIVSVAQAHGEMNRIVLVNALQLSAIAAAGVALVWAATRPWLARMAAPAGGELPLLATQQFLAIGFNALFIAPLLLHLIALPYRVGRGTFAGGRGIGWLAVLLTIGAIVAVNKVLTRPAHALGLAAALLALASLLSFRVAEVDVANWTGLHAWLASLVAIPWLLLLARELPRNQMVARMSSQLGINFDSEWATEGEILAALVGAVAVLVALRMPFSDPTGAWWPIGALLLISAFAASLNWITFRRAYVYAAGILFNLAVSIWVIKYQSQPISSLAAFVEANVIALSLTGIVWLLLELRSRRAQPASKFTAASSFHNVAALASLLALAAVVIARVNDDLYGFYQTQFPLLDLFALGSLTALLIACLWDAEARYSVASLYVIGLLAAATLLHHRPMTPPHLVWSLAMAAAIQAFAAALIWRARRTVVATASRLKIPARIDPSRGPLEWLCVFNCIVIAIVAMVALWSDVVFAEWWLRGLASVAVVTQAFTFGLMAEGGRRQVFQRAAVAMLLTGLVLIGWSMLTPGASGTWLNRAVVLMSLMFATVALFGWELDKLIEREPDWTKAWRDCVPSMSVAGVVALGFILATEIYYQIEFGAVRIRFLALLTVAVTLAAAIVVCIFFAVSPKHDPLTLSDRWRGSYVYAAEALMVLLFMHIRLTMPWLFHGFFQRYWPLVVLVIAYAGVAIAEFFRRREVHVLAKPVERTGAFLPLLPVIGFWIAQSQVEYSTLLFVVGGLYGLLSILRRSFFFGLAAALAGNGGLWYLLHETSEYHFYQHPQMWLIPAAISVLIAAHLNRKDFSESQMTGIRYLCLTAIYVSSTADIFINGVASSPWLPLVLAALSVAGVFTGMVFRVRAFLLLGSMFLLLAIATMIKFAAVNFGWTWLWYVAGIATGAAIIATFAVFEKKRAEVLRVVDGLKDWKG